MQQTTISIYLSQNSVLIFLRQLKVISDLNIETDYVFDLSTINYSLCFKQEYIQINLPVNTWTKFMALVKRVHDNNKEIVW